MSFPSVLSEKHSADDSPDEDSGHDSAESLNVPVDDRERIMHMESAISWIREEVLQLRNWDKEILQDLWKIRTGIHDIRESQRKQVEAEKRFLDTPSSSLNRQYSNESDQVPESPITPLPAVNRLSVSAFDFRTAPSHLVQQNDDAVLESFFGSEQMTKLNEFKKALSVENVEAAVKSQSNEKLGPSGLPPIPEKKRAKSTKAQALSDSSKNRAVHSSDPDVSEKKKEPVGDVVSEMTKLRMRLRETATQAVAEIDKKFSPKFERLKLGPSIELPSTTPAVVSGSHSHQGSLDSSTPAPLPSHLSGSAYRGHSRQHSLPLNAMQVAQPRAHSPTAVSAPSPPKSPSPTHNRGNCSRSPSLSPTPPLQPHHAHQGSQGSSSGSGTFSPPLSGLITTSYQNMAQAPMHGSPQVGHHAQYPHQTSSRHSPPLPSGVTYPSHRPPPAPPMGRQHSPSGQGGVKLPPGNGKRGSGSGISGGNERPRQAHNVHYSSLDREYGHTYASNPNLHSRSHSMQQDTTHYSTTVIKKRRSDGKINVPPFSEHPQRRNGYSTVPGSYEQPGYDHLSPTGTGQQSFDRFQPEHKSVPRSSQRPQSAREPRLTKQTHSAGGNMFTYGDNLRHSQAPLSSSDMNLKSPEKIQPYMSTGEVRAELKAFNYVPYAEQRKMNKQNSEGVGHYPHRQVPENTWC